MSILVITARVGVCNRQHCNQLPCGTHQLLPPWVAGCCWRDIQKQATIKIIKQKLMWSFEWRKVVKDGQEIQLENYLFYINRLWATWCTGRCHWPWQEAWTRWSLRSLHSQTILWFHQHKKIHSVKQSPSLNILEVFFHLSHLLTFLN